MKPHLHKTLNLKAQDAVAVYLDEMAYVFFADDDNYQKYLNEQTYDYYGTIVEESPFYLAPPEPGVWNLVIEQKDPEKSLDVKIEIIKEESFSQE
ncbi:MAG: hypothetical protein DRP59_08395 [Spirochaetes bacterium]|nr:MAG: hypothetical protein DRP59_08395 [Spirochaetota bacterium]